MKLLTSLTAASLVLIGSLQGLGFGFNLGPFNLQFNAGGAYYPNHQRDLLDNPICFAISHQKRLEMIVEGTEKISAQEIKIVTKKLVVEPYAFGVTREDQPVLRGNVVEDKLLKEVVVKYGEERFSESDLPAQKKTGYFSGWFKSDQSQDVDISQVSDILVIEDSHFEAPKSYQGLKDDNVRVVCQLPIKT